MEVRLTSIRNEAERCCCDLAFRSVGIVANTTYEGWNFNSGNYLFTTDTK